MNQKEFQEEYEKSYHFFLSELKSITNNDLSYLIELMRASQHIKDIQKLMIKMNPEGLSEEDEMKYRIENDSMIIMVLNISAAQLREALKVFWKFTETPFFKELYEELSLDNRKHIDELKKINDEYGQKTGFIWDVLEQVRNSMFHYFPDKSILWIAKIKEMELESKPPIQSINLEKFDFSPGMEYDKEIYSKYLFWGENGFESSMKSQKKVWDTQLNFLNSVKNLVEAVLIKENVSKRKYGWFMKFFHGYKS